MLVFAGYSKMGWYYARRKRKTLQDNYKEHEEEDLKNKLANHW